MLRNLFVMLVLMGWTPTVWGDDLTAESVGKTLNPYLDNRVAAVARIDVAKVELNAYLGLDNVVTGSAGRTLKRLRPAVGELHKQLVGAGAGEVYVVYSFVPDNLGPYFLIVPLSKGSNPAEIGASLSKCFTRSGGIEAKQFGEVMVIGTRDLIAAIGNGLRPNARPEFAEALVAGRDTGVNIVVSLSADQRRVLAELLPPFPANLNDFTPAELVRGIRSLSLAVDISDKPQGKLTARTLNAQAATRVAEFTNEGLRLIAAAEGVSKPVQTALAPGRFLPQILDNDVTFTLGADSKGVNSLTALLTDVTDKQWDNVLRLDVRSNLKRFALEMHNFYDSYGKGFPPSATQAKDGQPPVSWRVQVLQFIDSKLFARYRQNEPWDSEHNRTLLKEIPDVYTTLDQDRSTGLTCIQMPVNQGMMGGNPAGVQIKDVTDGTSDTIMLLQVDLEHAVPWTKPQDFEVDLKQPWKGIVAADEEGIWSVLIDGSARYWSKTADEDKLLKLLTIGGGEIITYQKFP